MRRSMRRGLFPTAAIGVGLACLGGASIASDAPSGTAPAAAPRLELEATEIDLGTIERGETAEALFVLRNTGARELRILEVKPG